MTLQHFRCRWSRVLWQVSGCACSCKKDPCSYGIGCVRGMPSLSPLSSLAKPYLFTNPSRPRDQVFPWLVVFYSWSTKKFSNCFTHVLSVRIVLDCIVFIFSFSVLRNSLLESDVCRLPFSVTLKSLHFPTKRALTFLRVSVTQICAIHRCMRIDFSRWRYLSMFYISSLFN